MSRLDSHMLVFPPNERAPQRVSEVTSLQAKYKAALKILTQWMGKHSETTREIEVQEEIRSDLSSWNETPSRDDPWLA